MQVVATKTVSDIPGPSQIAFGIGDVASNPDLFKIMNYTRQHGVIPNITTNGNVSGKDLNELVMVCGAIAVSNYGLKKTLKVIARIDEIRSKNGVNSPLQQINIHQLLSRETYDDCMQIMQEYLKNEKMRQMVNAIVFLSLKPKGRSTVHGYKPLDKLDKLRDLVNFALDWNVPIGFDSCTCNSFLKVIKGRENEAQLAQCADPCESTCFSIYIDVDCNAQPCSFSKDLTVPSVNLLEVEDFMSEVWFESSFVRWREHLISCKRNCPLYNLEMK